MDRRTLLIGTVAFALMTALVPAALADHDGDPISVCASGCDFASIQDAVNHANPGDTVEVEAGTYTESVHVNRADLALLGAKEGVPAGPAEDPDDRGTDESVIEGSVTLGAHGVTLDGFTVEPTAGAAVHIRGTGLTIANNILTGSGIGMRAIQFSDVELTANNIQEFGTGLLLDGGPNALPSLVEENYLGDLGHGVSMFGSLAGGHTFSANVLEDIDNGGLVVVEQINVLNNTFRNIVTPEGASHPGYGILVFVFEDQVTDVRIEGNELVDNGIGIWSYDGGGTPENNVARFNVIAGNEIGVQNDLETTFDARHNYWGAPTGTLLAEQGIGDGTEGEVDAGFACALEDCTAMRIVHEEGVDHIV